MFLWYLIATWVAVVAGLADSPPPLPPQGSWPFTFAETLTLITTITASMATVIGLFRIEKVHTIVNSNAAKQDQKIVDLQAALTSERTINALAEGVRQALAKETAENLSAAVTPAVVVSAAAGAPSLSVTIPGTPAIVVPVEEAQKRIISP